MAKSISKIVIVVLLIVLFGYIAINGLSLTALNIPYKFYSVFDEDNGIRLGFDLSGGSVIVYEAQDATPDDEQMSTVVDIMYKRLDNNCTHLFIVRSCILSFIYYNGTSR